MKVDINNIKKIVVFGMVLLLVLGVFGGVASARQLWFTKTPGTATSDDTAFFDFTPSVFKLEIADLRLSQDGGTTWTEDLLDGSVLLDFTSVSVGEKVDGLISNKALPTGTYNAMKIIISKVTVKGVVAVDPNQWSGKGEDGTTNTLYYYTVTGDQAGDYKGTQGEAETAAQEYTFWNGSWWRDVSIHILAGETTVFPWGISIGLVYEVEYDDTTKVFISGLFYPWVGGI